MTGKPCPAELEVARRLAQQLVRPADVLDRPQPPGPAALEDCHRTLQRVAELGLAGGMVYDALIACAAQKLDVEALVTFNVSDFRRVWPEGHDRIIAP